jgi:hypothetical protein
MKYWELIADDLSKAGWSWGLRLNSRSGRANDLDLDAHRNNGKRFIKRAEES